MGCGARRAWRVLTGVLLLCGVDPLPLDLESRDLVKVCARRVSNEFSGKVMVY